MSLGTKAFHAAMTAKPRGSMPMTGLAAWFDASDAASLHKTGSTVNQWDDKSGNGKHLRDTGLTTSPALYSAAGLNGKPAVDFGYNGSQGGLGTIAALSSVMMNAFTIVCVKQPGITRPGADFTAMAQAFLTGCTAAHRVGMGVDFASAMGFEPGVPNVTATVVDGTQIRCLLGKTVEPAAYDFTGWKSATPMGVVQVGLAYTSYASTRISEILIYSRALTNQELLSLSTFLRRKWSITLAVPTANIIHYGNSITAGWTTTSNCYTMDSVSAAGFKAWDHSVIGVPGAKTDQLMNWTGSKVDPRYNPALPAKRNIVLINEITNSLSDGYSAATIQGWLQTTCQNLRASKGWKVAVHTALPHTIADGTWETRRLTLNQWLRDHYTEFSDGLVDWGAEATMGVTGANTNGALYPDGLHPSSAGHVYLAPPVTAVINAIAA